MVMPELPHASVPKAQGTLLGIPYDWRRPTATVVQARIWNPDNPRIFTPKPFGHGHVINGYWLAHPVRYWNARRRDAVS
jgi:uncharacterized protein DUF5808